MIAGSGSRVVGRGGRLGGYATVAAGEWERCVAGAFIVPDPQKMLDVPGWKGAPEVPEPEGTTARDRSKWYSPWDCRVP